MRKVNLNNPDEARHFKSEVSGYMWVSETCIIPYRMDGLTEKGANYTILVPLKWKQWFTQKRLRATLRNEVDADCITIEYINFVRE